MSNQKLNERQQNDAQMYQQNPYPQQTYPQQNFQQPSYQQPTYPQYQYQQPTYQYPYQQPQYYPQYPQYQQPNYPQMDQALPFIEQSYIENILRMNKGKEATIYMNFENSQWGSKVFKGLIEAAGKDHIILSDPRTGMRYLLLTIYLDYITFDEEINYYYPYANLGMNPMVQPRKEK